MALGDLSPDQARYVDLVAQATGLARPVVVAWVGTESGWGRNKAGHNYLNIGPGRTYPSTQHAAAAGAGLINASDHYAGIRAAVPAGGGAQIEAIGASPWGTSASLLNRVYQQLISKSSSGGATVETVGLEFVPGIPVPLPESPLPGIPIPGTDKLPGIDLPDPIKDAAAGLGKTVLDAGLTLIFTVAAFGFIAMGINRLTGAQPKSLFQTISGAVGTATSVAGAGKLAAV